MYCHGVPWHGARGFAPVVFGIMPLGFFQVCMVGYAHRGLDMCQTVPVSKLDGCFFIEVLKRAFRRPVRND